MGSSSVRWGSSACAAAGFASAISARDRRFVSIALLNPEIADRRYNLHAMRRRPLVRRLAVSLVFALSGTAVAWLSIVPAALRAGAFRQTAERRISETLGFPVRIGQLDMPDGRTLLARRVSLSPTLPGLGTVEIETVTVRFNGLAPLSDVRDVAIDGVRATVDIAPDKLRELARPSDAPGPAAPHKPLRLTGPLPLPPIHVTRLEIDGRVGSQLCRIRQGEVRIDPAGPFVISFAATGRLETSPDPEIDVRGALELTETSGRVRFDRVKIATFAANAGLDVPRDDAATASLKLEAFKIPHAFLSLFESFTGMKASGLVTTHCTFSLESRKLARLEFEGELADYEVSGEGVRLKNRKGRTRLTAAVEPHPDGGWRATGKLGDLEIGLGGGAVLHFSTASYETRVDGLRSIGAFRFEDAYFARDDLESTKVAGELAFDVTRSEGDRVFAGTARLTIFGAELLKGELYQELDPKSAVALTLAGRFDLNAGTYEFKGASLSIGGIGRVAVDGLLRRTKGAVAYDVAFETDALSAAAIAQKLAGVWSIPDLSMEGTVRAKARLAGEGGSFTLDGRAMLDALTVRKGALSVVKLSGNVPVLLAHGAKLDRVEKGSLEWADVVPCPGVALGPQKLEVAARENSIRFPDVLSFPLWDGRAQLGEISLWNLVESPRVDFKCGVDDMDLQAMATALEVKRKLPGRASISWGSVFIGANHIAVTETARLSMFQGAIELQHPRVLKPFDGTNRAFQFGFSLAGIRLRDVCRTLSEFGLIDGVVNAGGAMELHASGLPNWFRIVARTVERPGVEQMCDLQAIRALATLIGGPEMGDQIGRLPADKLYYEKFGFYAAMDIDFTFYPRGLYFQPERTGRLAEQDIEMLKFGKRPEEKGREFIMVGTGRTRVNIDIVNPGGGIDFNDMIDRFKKVERK